MKLRKNTSKHLEKGLNNKLRVKVIDPEGNDVTPEN